MPTTTPSTPSRPHRTTSGTAIVVGGSLAGLMSALTLAREGLQVTVLERVSHFPRTGAALGVSDSLIRSITGEPASRAGGTDPDGSSWSAIHTRLRAAVAAEPRIDLRHEARVSEVGQDEQAAWVRTADGHHHSADLVVGADGYRSTVRAHVAPAHPQATFAGYLIWLGLVDADLVPAARHTRATDFLSSGDQYFFGYTIEATDSTPRQIGWAWYDNTRNDLLQATGAVAHHGGIDVVQHTVTPAQVPEGTYRALAAEAKRRWPSPWAQAIAASASRRVITATPIAEYVPQRLVNGRLVIVGDAAHVQTPMTGQGFPSALEDARALATAVRAGLDREAASPQPASPRAREQALEQAPKQAAERAPEQAGALPAALLTYEQDRLPDVQRMVRSGQQFSRSFGRRAA